MRARKLTKLLLEVMVGFPVEIRRKHFQDLTVVVEENIFQITPDGKFYVATYQPNLITFYADMVVDDEEEAKKILIHELAHHFGFSEARIRDLGY